MMHTVQQTPINFTDLVTKIKDYARSLAFDEVAITDTDLSQAEPRLLDWLAKNFHGEMHYMAAHGSKRSRPEQLIPGTLRVITVRMNYLSSEVAIGATLANKAKAYIARYALGRDYHKLLRKRLAKLAEMISAEIPDHHYRVFADSAPVMEKPLAEKAGLGWIGKHTNLVHPKAGSWFFLGTIYTNLPLPIDAPQRNHCGRCQACIDICPTQAIVGPYQLDARRCIAYLTIEYRGSIPLALRPLIGNRIFGCDDCQWICPWNKFAKRSQLPDFQPRHDLDTADLLTLFQWSAEEYEAKTRGSALARIGYEGWRRNVAVALGNAETSAELVAALQASLADPSPLVREHVEWALARHDK